MRLGDQAQHHVERGGAAGAGQPRPVDLEQLAGDVEVGKILAEGVAVLPVHGAAEAVEQASPGKQIAAGRQRAEAAAAASLPAQRGDHRRIAQTLHREAGDDDGEVDAYADRESTRLTSSHYCDTRMQST